MQKKQAPQSACSGVLKNWPKVGEEGCLNGGQSAVLSEDHLQREYEDCGELRKMEDGQRFGEDLERWSYLVYLRNLDFILKVLGCSEDADRIKNHTCIL